MTLLNTPLARAARTLRRLFRLDRAAMRVGLALFVVALWAGSAAAQYTVTDPGDGAGSSSDVTLRYAITQANAYAAANPSDHTQIAIDIVLPPGSTISLGGNLPPIDANLAINGHGLTINGAGQYAAFFVDSGTVAIKNVTIENTNAVGGTGGWGGGGGGGGLGAGGALFVNNTANVTIQNVTFANNSATGGNGGLGTNNNVEGGGGGGGFHGAGGNASQPGGGGGGGFAGAGGLGTWGGAGGGGLYGAGGAGSSVFSAGGGGGGGILLNGGAGAGPFGGLGALTGGNGATVGGANGTSGAIGGGGGGGASGYLGTPNNAGNGGRFGGGGGAGFSSGTSGSGGEFGGGGGAGSNLGGAGGAGGFGAGGGGGAGPSTGTLDSAPGTGGFGAGNGGVRANGGDGGNGLGGAVFVRTGGTLTIVDSGISGSSVTAGLGGDSHTGVVGTDGTSDGAGIFAMTGVTTNVQVNSGTQTYADSIGGDGGLTKTGAGTLVLSGSNDYTGDTEVAAGTLSITGWTTSGNTIIDSGAHLSDNGDIENNVTVNAGGSVYGSGWMGSLTNNGTIAMGNSLDVLTITGTFNQGASGTLQMGIVPGGSAFSNSSWLFMDNVSPSTTIGGRLEIDPTVGHYNTGTNYVVLVANGPTGNFSSIVVDNAPTAQVNLQTTPVIAGGNPYTELYFNFLNSFNVYDNFAQYATTPNQMAVANYIDANSLDPALQNLVNTLNSLSPAGVQNALDQMSGALYGSVAQTDLQSDTIELSFIMRRLGNGLSGVNGAPGGVATNSYGEKISPTALASPDSGLTVRGQNATYSPFRARPGNWTTWGFGYGLGGNASGTSNAAGLNYSLGGTVVGLETHSENHLLGFYTGYVGSHLGSYLAGQSVGVNGGQLGTYLRGDDGLNYYVLLGGMGADGYNSRRLMQFGGINTTATANYGGWQSQAYFERGVTLQGSKMSIQPYAALQYLYVRENAFTETGAGAMNLKVSGIDANSLRSLIGVRLAGYGMTTSGGRQITPVARALWLHEFLSTTTGLNAQFAPIGGSNFAVTGTSLGRDWAILGTGLNCNLGGGWQTYANYDAQVNVAQVFHVGSGGFQYSW